MKYFYWNLNEKEKFIRSLWLGLISIFFLAFVTWNFVEDPTGRLAIPIVAFVIYLVDLFIKFRKYKSVEHNNGI